MTDNNKVTNHHVKPRTAHYSVSNPDLCDDEYLPSAWQTYAEGKGVPEPDIWPLWRRFKDEHRGKGLRGLAQSIELFAIGRDWIKWFGVPGFCEHPVSTISTYYRKADYKFHPHDYTGYCEDDNYTKETHIWGYNGFIMPEPRRALMLEAPDDRIHKAPPGPDRKNFRSATPMGFADAVYISNLPKP